MGRPGGTARRPVVVDFSAMWAGPLCAHVLGRAGCRVIKVEDPARPDGSRVGDRALFERLHAGHELAAVHFGSAAGRRALDALLDEADVVVEASRPRALGNLGLSPEAFLAGRPGRTWVSITGYGRSGPWSDRVAFGDDAAVAGGLVAWDADGRPVFCADAVADPISGMYAALAAVLSLNAGGGHLIDVAMRDAAAFVASGQTCPGRHRVTRRPDGGWMAHHDGLSAPVAPPARLSAP